MELKWVTQMEKAIDMLVDACQQNYDFSACKLCPFHQQCEVLAYNNFNYPDSWKED